MSVKSRMDRLMKTVPCPTCDASPAGTIFKWLNDDEEPPDTTDERPERCPTCGRVNRQKVIYVSWMRAGQV